MTTNPNFEERLKQLLHNIESMKEPVTTGLDEFQIGLAEGTFNGMTSLASQIRALMEDAPKKPLTMGCPVRITEGPWKDYQGFYQGLAATMVGAQVEVLLENMDLPILIKQEYIEVI
jgi:hypothetical protein